MTNAARRGPPPTHDILCLACGWHISDGNHNGRTCSRKRRVKWAKLNDTERRKIMAVYEAIGR